MPIPAVKLHEETRDKLNRVNSEYGRKFSTAELDIVLTEAYHTYVENRLQMVEFNSSIREELRLLERKHHPLKFKVNSSDNTVYEAEFPEEYLRSLRIFCDATKEGCGEKRLRGMKVKSSHLNEALVDPFMKPSFEFEEFLLDEGEKLYAYTDGTFSLKSLFMDYIVKPGRITCPSLAPDRYYIDSTGEKIEHDEGLPLDNFFQKKAIVDIAALIALRNLGDVADYQSQLDKILRIKSL